MPVYAIIVGAGKGRRFGGLKQFIDFEGMPLLLYTTRIFERAHLIDRIIVVVPEFWVDRIKNLFQEYGFKKVTRVVAGGKRRQDSVLNGIKTIENKKGIVVIHDAVRPFISESLISKGIKLCQKYKAVIFGIPIYDTVKLVSGKRVVETVPRISPYAIQTPQFFDIEYLMNAYGKFDFKKEYTDEAAIIESVRLPVFVFKGDPGNIKLTTKKDLELLKGRK